MCNTNSAYSEKRNKKTKQRAHMFVGLMGDVFLLWGLDPLPKNLRLTNRVHCNTELTFSNVTVW